jgi:hypothetical protein
MLQGENASDYLSPIRRLTGARLNASLRGYSVPLMLLHQTELEMELGHQVTPPGAPERWPHAHFGCQCITVTLQRPQTHFGCIRIALQHTQCYTLR